MSTEKSIKQWHEKARPAPSEGDFNVQLGCHFEEISEMLVALEGQNAVTRNKLSEIAYQMSSLATAFKDGRYDAEPMPRTEFLDSLCDQIVTAIGVAHCSHMKIDAALALVNESNWNKFVDGEPLRDGNGKIKKPVGWTSPRLEGCV
jgi:hypothetical protein